MSKQVIDKLDNFIKSKKIPHILFHGENIKNNIERLHYLLDNVTGYTDVKTRRENILYVNCAYGKGIKFIREQLKFFAKTNIMNKMYEDKKIFKSIVLLHADFLTIDAQSALRRCIELYSQKTRFFIVVMNKDSIIKPIQSRFCDVFVNSENSTKKQCNLNINIYDKNRCMKKRLLIKILTNIDCENQTYLGKNIFTLSTELFNQGVYYKDFIDVFTEIIKDMDIRYSIITFINKIRYEIKNEKMLFMMILNIYCLRNNLELENIYPF
jgi:DNA polymerase III delta prime subunit